MAYRGKAVGISVFSHTVGPATRHIPCEVSIATNGTQCPRTWCSDANRSMEANARFIAAAPDMEKALEGIPWKPAVMNGRKPAPTQIRAAGRHDDEQACWIWGALGFGCQSKNPGKTGTLIVSKDKGGQTSAHYGRHLVTGYSLHVHHQGLARPAPRRA